MVILQTCLKRIMECGQILISPCMQRVGEFRGELELVFISFLVILLRQRLSSVLIYCAFDVEEYRSCYVGFYGDYLWNWEWVCWRYVSLKQGDVCVIGTSDSCAKQKHRSVTHTPMYVDIGWSMVWKTPWNTPWIFTGNLRMHFTSLTKSTGTKQPHGECISP